MIFRRLSEKVKNYKIKYSKVVPRNVNNATAIDLENGDKFWLNEEGYAGNVSE